jgi:hypothetical protein
MQKSIIDALDALGSIKALNGAIFALAQDTPGNEPLLEVINAQLTRALDAIKTLEEDLHAQP